MFVAAIHIREILQSQNVIDRERTNLTHGTIPGSPAGEVSLQLGHHIDTDSQRPSFTEGQQLIGQLFLIISRWIVVGSSSKFWAKYLLLAKQYP